MKTLLLTLFIAIFLDAKTFEQAFNIKSIKPKMQTQQISNSYYATTAYDERRIYDVSVRFSGYIQNLYANELYKRVKKGDKLFDIYPKHIRTVKKEFEFYEYDKGIQSIIAEQLKDEEIDEKILSNGELNIPFYSSFSGVIFEKNIFVGSHVKKGDSVFKIADTSNMWVIAKVYQKDLEFIKTGMKAVISIDGLNKDITAKVSKIYPKVTKEDLTFDVRMDIDNKDGKIFPDMIAMSNLLSNAIKYNKYGGKIELTLAQNEFIITNNGTGIDKEAKSKIFDRFYRAADYEGGFGIGLDIVKSVCNKYNINIKIDSIKNEITTIRLEFFK